MLYILALLFPPIAYVICHITKIWGWFVGFVLLILQFTVFGWLFASIVALLAVIDYKSEKRMAKYAGDRR